MSIRLEGLPRHSSTHAAGVVICDQPVNEYVPLNTNDGVVTTQFHMGTCEELGLLKMDFLGLRTLTVIRIAAEEVARSKGIDIDLDTWTYEDPAVYEAMSHGKTAGLFQLESSGMTSFFQQLRPTGFEDVTAGISLYRPGPMDNIPAYLKGKNNASKVRYEHKLLQPILETTYGVMVYQEQVMQIVQELAGFSLGRADLIRRAMGKKDMKKMAQEREGFIEGCSERGVPEKAAGNIFDTMSKFAEYAFNKSHAAGYAVVSYQTAWMKLYHPVEFMAALMTSVMDSSDKVAAYIRESKKMGITLLPPDVNSGYGSFSVDGNAIRFGLSAVKNVGRATVDALVAERKKNGKYLGMADFIRRLSATADVNKRCLDSLIRAGAFDALGGHRSQYLAVYAGIISGLATQKKTTIEGQMSLFDMGEPEEAAESATDELPPLRELPKRELLNAERELLGIYVSGHPLAEYEETLAKYTDVTGADFGALSLDEAGDEESVVEAPSRIADKQVVKFGGMITAKKVQYTKKDNAAFAFITVEDTQGSVEVIVFPKVYEKAAAKLQLEQVLIVQGRVSVREDEAAKITAMELMFYEDIPAKNSPTTPTFWIKIPIGTQVSPAKITDMLKQHAGDTPVVVYNEETAKRIRMNNEFWVAQTPSLISEMEKLLGQGNAKFTGV
jgi:DNA polymerase-3 subunit alpha